MNHWLNTSLENIIEWHDGVLYTENWMPVPMFSNYMISSFGRVKSLSKIKVNSFAKNGFRTKEKIIKQNVSNFHGYLFLSMCDNSGKVFTKNTHRLVAQCFIENELHKPQVNHIKGVKTDNRVHQLEWSTRSENQKHAYSIGLKSKVGENHHLVKLTEKLVLLIRDKFKDGVHMQSLATEFNVSRRNIYSIVKRESWVHI